MRRMWALLLGVMILGCTSSAPKTDDAAKPQSAPSLTDWRQALGGEVPGASATIGGRRLQVIHRSLTNDAAYGRLLVRRAENFHALRDLDTGQDLLPMDFQELFLIPNIGVMVMKPADRVKRYEALNDAINNRRKPDEPKLPRIYFSRLDPATGQYSPTDIRQIHRFYAGPNRWSHAVQRDPEDPSAIDHCSADFFDPQGLITLTVPRLTYSWAFEPFRSPITGFIQFSAIGDDDKPIGYLLNPTMRPMFYPVEQVKVFKGLQLDKFGRRPEYGLPNDRDLYAIPAPGQPAEADLWLILDNKGNFSAPEGAIGFRPLRRNDRKPAPAWVDSWLVLYNAGDDPKAARWGWADSKLANVSGPIYSDARLVLPPQPNPPTHPGGEGFARWPEEEPFLMLQKDGVWQSAQLIFPTAEPVKSPRGPVNVKSRDYQQVFDATMAGLAQWPGARQAAAAAEAAYQRELARLRSQGDWEEALRRRDASQLDRMIWSRPAEDWYTYVRQRPYATPEQFEQAAGFMTDPVKAKELRDRAVESRQQQARLRQIAAAAESRSYAAERSAVQSRVSSSSWTSNYGSSASVNTWTGGSASQQMANYNRSLDRQFNAVLNKPSWSTWNPR